VCVYVGGGGDGSLGFHRGGRHGSAFTANGALQANHSKAAAEGWVLRPGVTEVMAPALYEVYLQRWGDIGPAAKRSKNPPATPNQVTAHALLRGLQRQTSDSVPTKHVVALLHLGTIALCCAILAGHWLGV